MIIQHLHFQSNASIQDSPESSSDEGWLLSYLDVFILIVALLVIMLTKSQPSAPSILQEQKVQEPEIKTISTELEALSSDYRLTILSNEKNINVRLGDTLLFDSSKAIITPDGKQAIKQLVPVLKRLKRSIIIEGHTDNHPINTILYPSNWELSAARANSVLHYLISQGLPPNSLSIRSYADTHPIMPNNNELNRSVNRRVNLIILME
jgi:chemotaxis protein MotB